MVDFQCPGLGGPGCTSWVFTGYSGVAFSAHTGDACVISLAALSGCHCFYYAPGNALIFPFKRLCENFKGNNTIWGINQRNLDVKPDSFAY